MPEPPPVHGQVTAIACCGYPAISRLSSGWSRLRARSTSLEPIPLRITSSPMRWRNVYTDCAVLKRGQWLCSGWRLAHGCCYASADSDGPELKSLIDAAFTSQLEALARSVVFDPDAGVGPCRLAIAGRFRSLVRLCISCDAAPAGSHCHDCEMAGGAALKARAKPSVAGLQRRAFGAIEINMTFFLQSR